MRISEDSSAVRGLKCPRLFKVMPGTRLRRSGVSFQSYPPARRPRQFQKSSAAHGLYLIPDGLREIGAVEPGDLLQPGRRRNIYFGQVITDDVDTGEKQPFAFQDRGDACANLQLARGELRRFRAPPGMQVG